jgi:hypothetical protein
MAAVGAAGCGGGPTSPSGNGRTTIAGTVNVQGGAATLPGAAASSLTVTVAGTNLSAVVDESGFFQLVGVPSGTVKLVFKDAGFEATVEISNVGGEALIEISVQLTGNTATIVNEVRTDAKVSLCHRTEAGFYQPISVSTSAEPAHMNHGDGKPGQPVPGQTTQTFDENCKIVGPAVRVEKSTNGEDADEAPGPRIPVGSPVQWQYVVTNIGTVPLTNVEIDDDQDVTVTCPKTTLAVGESMTCTASGTATAGQYRNVGRVSATAGSVTVTDSDASHYFGVTEEDEEEGPKVQLCHKTGAGFYVPIEVSVSAEPAHRAHGDGKIGEDVRDVPGKRFGPGCSLQ